MLIRRAAGLAFVVTGARYLAWRPGTIGDTGALGIAFFICEVTTFAFGALTILLVWKQLHRTGPPHPPEGTLDILIPVCGEPAWMVEKTLQAALAIDYPHKTYILNDGFIAKKKNWRDIEKLAHHYKVPSFRRTSGARRKAGNLNRALGLTSGQFVAVIDADHEARPNFAHETLGYFAGDEKVAVVSTKQEFTGGPADILGNRELLFYKAIQPAKDRVNAAFSTGNAAVYRREALEDIGGFSEWNVVEDLHTTYELHAAGWKSTFHPRSITVGLAPRTGATLVKQRLQWSTDTLRVFFWDNPLFKRGLTLMQRLHYLHTTGYYLWATAHLLFLLAPAMQLLWGMPVMQPPSAQSYLGHSIPFLVSVGAFLIAHGGFRGGLRSAQSGLFLSPIYLLGAIAALTKIKFRMRVTDKAHEHSWSWLMMPHVAVFAVSVAALVVGFRGDRGDPRISAFWAAWAAFSVAGLIGSVSVRAHVGRLWRTSLRLPVVGIAALVFLLPQPTGFAIAGDFVEAQNAIVPAKVPAGAPVAGVVAPPKKGAYFGVFNPDLLSRPDAVIRWNKNHGARARIVHWYQQWLSGDSRFRADWLRMIARQGAVPFITWEPWAKPEKSQHGPEQPEVTHAAIISGRYDRYIRAWAKGAAAYRGPIMLRFMHEMNGNWYPWSIRTNGNSEKSFVKAWRHVHDLFASAGATNVTWVWTINTFAGMSGDNRKLAEYYPGPTYVDWVSATGFNWGNSYSWNAWVPYDYIFRSTYLALYKFRKPIVISEIATTEGGGNAAAWIGESLDRMRSYPLVRAVLWFDARYDRSVDFMLRGAATKALSAGLNRDSYWRQRPVVSERPSLPPALWRPRKGW